MASSIDASTSGAGGVITTADNTGILNLKTAGTNAVTIDTSQKVGIGTASPNTKLHVVATGTGNCARLESASGPNLAFAGTETSGRTYLIGEGLVTAGNFSIYDNNAALERMIIDSSGNVLVGTTSTIAAIFAVKVANSGSAIQTVNTSGTALYNAALFYNNGTTLRGSIGVSGSSTAYNTSSDYRLKENIIPMTGALETIAQLKPVTYKWKSDGSNGQGFIAHELQEIVPDCVTGEKDAVDEEGNIKPQGIDTSFLVATLTAAIQEQQTLIVSQSELINSLTARVTALEAK